MFFDLIRKRNGNWKDDTLSGLTVALALVPEAIAFSFIAGVGPLVGLWAAVFMGLITSAFGGRPGRSRHTRRNLQMLPPPARRRRAGAFRLKAAVSSHGLSSYTVSEYRA